MKYLRILLIVVTLCGFHGVQGAPPIEYNVAVRNSDGKVMANMPVKFLLEIVDSPSDGTVLYSETQSIKTDPSGIAPIMAGEGTPITGDFDTLDWSAPRFLSVKVDVDGSGVYRSLGTMQLLGAPLAREARISSALMFTTPSGDVTELTVDNMGDLKWTLHENLDEPQYDQSKVPDKLYFIGTFNNWEVAEAVEMTKLSPTKFTIDRHLSVGDIFKFVPKRSWTSLDWSGTAVMVGSPVTLRELGNTPAFIGPEGDYTITIDFYRYTMLITRK